MDKPAHWAHVAEAFSRKALVYDTFGQDHPNLARLRGKVYRTVLDQLQPASHILELNAGTGTDATFFARQGFHVHVTDIAPGMIAQIERKIKTYNLQERLTVQPCSFTDLAQIGGEPFDCIFSNFGGLNCLEDLQIVTQALPRLLRPGGIVVWIIMPPICLWELANVFAGDWRSATRRLARHGVRANVDGVQFTTYYFTPRQVIRAFGRAFKFERLQGLSVFTPPADRKNFARRFSALYKILVWLDDRLADVPPGRGWGDFFILTMRYVQLI